MATSIRDIIYILYIFVMSDIYESDLKEVAG